MGFDCALAEVGTYRYEAQVGEGLVENEIDHLLAGEFDGAPTPDPGEAADWRWEDPDAVLRDAAATPARFTAWLRGGLERVLTAARPPPTARAAPG
jgi:isopentenyl-diphosphate delta-isomerase